MLEKTTPSFNNEILRQVKWVIRLRWIAVGAVVFFAALTRLFFAYRFSPVLGFAVFILTYNYIAWRHYNHCLQSDTLSKRATQLNLHAQITLDIFAITWAVHITGGAESKIIPFYFVHTPLLGLAISRRSLLNYVVLISSALALIFGLEFYDILSHGNLNTIINPRLSQNLYKDYKFLVSTWTSTTLFLFLGAFMTNYLRERFHFLLRDKEKALLESENLRNVALSLSSTLKWEETLDIILDSVNELISFDSAVIILFKEEGARIIAGQGISAKLINSVAPLQTNCIKDFLLKKKNIPKNSTKIDKLFWEILDNQNIQSSLCTAMVAHNTLLGVLAIGSNTPNLYGEKDTLLVQSFGNYAALSLKNSQLYEKTRQESLKDGLTGLNNRRSLNNQLEKEEARAKRYGRNFSLLMCDLDEFKNYNDRYGHLAGDDLLREISALMKNSLRHNDQVFRYGGEEFIILLPETKREQACSLAERLRKMIEKHEFILQDSEEITHITISMGLSVFPEDADNAKSLLQNADEALYKAKEKRNSVICHASTNK